MATQPLIPNNIDFATEVKSDRLRLLWKVTFVACAIVLIVAVITSTVEAISITLWYGAPIVMMGFCLLTQWALERQYFNAASLIYTLGGIVALSVGLIDAHPVTLQVLPFLYVLVIFIGGLLLRPQHTLLVTLFAALASVLVPFVQNGNMDFMSQHQIFAILLMFVGAAMAAQVTGELYAVTEWALQNYQRERRTNYDLFESKLQLKKSLDRSEALSDALKDSNTALETARVAAEEAKNFRGKFLANMSHELRTPLNAIIGFSETMLKFPIMYDDVPLPENYRADMSQIYSSGQQLLKLINDILDLAKVDAGKLEIYRQRIDPRPIIESAATMAQGLVSSKPIKLVSHIPAELPDIWADDNRFRQVLNNVYSNAVKFTDTGEIVLTVTHNDKELQLSLRDTGVGIPEDKLESIFEEFQQGTNTGRDPRSGAGLGLTISRQLLSMMEGRIWVESKVGEGSTFYFTLPIYQAEKSETVEVTTFDAVRSAKTPTSTLAAVPTEAANS
ncbi:MAG: ATP-binding protein [Anaerolineae bacterium]